ncbi:MAG: hypothetical protein U5P41_00310 [Gammaproteobacteria bacterium]|nr:hypothetical protein [Gammaproteobacteria bacterium]
MKDHDYRDMYQGGSEISDAAAVPARSIWIYRYYQTVSEQLGEGERREIEDYASRLARLH